MCLHIVSQSSFNNPALENCLAIFQEGDALILVGDGVMSLLDSKICLPADSFVLKEDFDTRLNSVQDLAAKKAMEIQWIDYEKWVNLAIKHTQSISW